MSAEEMLALPENGCDRWLVAGELRERPMSARYRFHSRVMTRVAQLLANWLDAQPIPRGQVLTGDAAVRLQRNPDTLFGIDVVYVSAEVLALQGANSTIIDGVPTLAVEILSPSDTVEDLREKQDAFLDAGVPLVWFVDPYRKTVSVYRPDADPEMRNSRQDLRGDPHLPGFRVVVAQLFE